MRLRTAKRRGRRRARREYLENARAYAAIGLPALLRGFQDGILFALRAGEADGSFTSFSQGAIDGMREQLEGVLYEAHVRELRALAERYYVPRRNR